VEKTIKDFREIDAAVFVERMGSHIYDEFREDHITFDVCEASLESISNEDVVFGIPEHEDELQERLSAAYSALLVHTGHLIRIRS
jgi:hypothetical protein